MATAQPRPAQGQQQHRHQQPQPQQPQQQQSQQQGVPAASSKDPFDNVQAMFNFVLIQSGRYVREQRSGSSTRQQYAMRSIVPSAVHRFQDSLDQLELEIRQAQTVLRRDLALMQADRLKREREEAAERQRQAAASSAQQGTEQQPESAAQPSSENKEPEPANNDVAADQANEEKTDGGNADRQVPPIETASAAAPDPLFDGTPATGMAQDTFDFDAMFGDSTGGGDNADTAGNGETSNFDLNYNANDNEPSLLRDLEAFAKGDTGGNNDQNNTNPTLDFNMADLPDLSNNPPGEAQPQPNTTKPEESTITAQDQPAQPTENNTNNDNAANEDMMMTDNLDDLFNVEYENPEQTAFDEAFFGFGE